MMKPKYVSILRTFKENKIIMADCICFCGNSFKTRLYSINSGKASSCGCYHNDRLVSHGHASNKSPSLTYRSWVSMKNRCENPKSSDYSKYGAIGIKICARWQISFENFLADMGERSSTKVSLDRIDPFGDYSPDNCRWATAKQQANNRRKQVLYDFKGQKKNLTQIAEELKTSRQAIYYRIKAGWLEDTIFNF